MTDLHHDHSDGESEFDLEWLLGFVDPPRHPTDLLRHRFPSKVGGRPAWLDPLHLPPRDLLTCPATGRTMQFLAQVYAPVDSNPNAFHRAVFLFISPDGSKLTTPGAVLALRCQLPRRNQFYSFEPSKSEHSHPMPLPQEQAALSLAQDPWQVVLHERAASQAQRTQQAQQQRAASSPPSDDAESGELAHQAAIDGGASFGVDPVLFPEAELVVEPEPEDSGADLTRDAKARALLQQYRARTAQEGEYTEEELPGEVMDTFEEGMSEEQRHFAAFAARVAIEPAQVLRYCFDDGAAPLCPSPSGVPGPADVPKCPRCGGSRRFEFQIMPQLLNHLGVDASDAQAPDWGTIAVFSCAASCGGGVDLGPDESAYVEEWVWVQPPL